MACGTGLAKFGVMLDVLLFFGAGAGPDKYAGAGAEADVGGELAAFTLLPADFPLNVREPISLGKGVALGADAIGCSANSRVVNLTVLFCTGREFTNALPLTNVAPGIWLA